MSARLIIAALSLALMAFGFRHDPAGLERALASEDFGRRAAAIESITRRGSPELGSLLIPLILDGDERIRAMAIEATGALQLSEAVPALFEILRAQNEAERVAAIKALATIDDDASRDALARALLDPERELRIAVLINARVDGELISPAAAALDDPDAAVRALAAEALGASGDASALLSLVGKLGDSSTDVRVAVARALGELRQAESVPTLIGALDDPELRVREAAAIALSRFGSRSRREIAFSEESAPEAFRAAADEAAKGLLEFIERERSAARGAGILALAEFSDAPIERIIRLIHDESLELFLSRAIERLSDDPEARARILRALLAELERAITPSAPQRIADAILSALESGPAETLTPRLIEALELVPSARGALLNAIGASGGEEAAITLLLELERLRAEALRSGDLRNGGVSAAANDALGALHLLAARRGHDHRVIEPALSLLPHLNQEAAVRALELLAPLAPQALLPVLFRNIERTSNAVMRRASAAALAHYADEQALMTLLSLLDDHDPEVRASAGAGLAENAQGALLPHFLERVEREAPTDRRQALSIAGALISRGALDELSPLERAAVLDSLYQITQAKNGRLASEALHAISQSKDAPATERLFAAAASAVSRRDYALTAQALRALRSRPSAQARRILAELSRDGRSPLVRAAALFAFGQIAEQSDVLLIEEALHRAPLRAREAASFSLLELSERGLIDAERARSYCEALRTPSAVIRVNLFLLTERLGARCAAFDAPEEILMRSSDELLRFAAAALLTERGDRSSLNALERCTRQELHPAIVRRCAEPALDENERRDIRVRAALPEGSRPLRGHVLILQLADGRLLPALSDPRAEFSLHAIPADSLRLYEPASLPLRP